MSKPYVRYFKILLVALLFYVVGGSSIAFAADETLITDLRTQIQDRAEKIAEIEKEIKKFQKDLDVVGAEKSTLQNAIKTLDLSKQRLEADIRITQNRISSSNFQIEKLQLEIDDKAALIILHSDTLAESIRRIDVAETRSFVETLLSHEDITQVWEDVENLQTLQVSLRENLNELKIFKRELEKAQDEREQTKRELTNYRFELGNQKTVVEINQNAKNTLLKQTKNKESNYKSLIEEKRAAREEFERELLDFESQLKIAIDPNSIPVARQGVLAWPLDSVRVTQQFGDTSFARSGAYKGKGHNGIDLGASPGTPVRSALSGTVRATGNTDAFRGCYSYGKWSLIQHNNGLSSLYAHLSHISLGKGSQVLTGQVIGYSGNSGYSTGPHLHMGLFATQGVQLVRFGDIKAITNCANATVPVAPHNAYLNPLSYLPTL
jgi:murein DD-endopeptidase MepM/ murein hydrolase activator NlpD